MAQPLRALALALAIALVGSPSPAPAATQPSFDAGNGVLVLPMEAAGVPTVFELANPPRLVLDVPGLKADPQDRPIPNGLAGHLRVLPVTGGTRITITLRAPVRGRWSLRFDDAGAMRLSLPPYRGPLRPVAPPSVASPRPVATPMPTPKPTAPPTAKPSAAPTAKPSAAPTAKPSAAPTVRPSAAPTARPSAAPTARPSAGPTARPSLSPSPLASATPDPLAPLTPPPASSAPPTPSAAPATPGPSAEPPASGSALGTPEAPARPGPMAAVRLGRIDYNEDLRVMVLPLSAPVTAKVRSEANPARLVLDLPGVGVEAVQRHQHPAALVKEVVAFQLDAATTRVELRLARAIGSGYVVQPPKAVAGGTQLILRFDQKPVDGELEPLVMPSIDIPTRPSSAPTARPSAAPSARPTPAPSVRPSLRPSAAPTPKPTPRSTPKPTARPTPKPSARPTARPSVAPSPRPSARPTPSPRPVATGHPFGGSVYHIATGEPLPGARIAVGGKSATTDGAGRFQLEGLAAGKLHVEVQAQGFASQSFDIMLPEDRTISLNLVPVL